MSSQLVGATATVLNPLVSGSKRLSSAMGMGLPLLIVLGPAFIVTSGKLSAPVLWLEIALVGVVGYELASGEWVRSKWRPIPVLVGLLPLVPIVLIHASRARGLITLLHLAGGMVGGWAFAWLWWRLGKERWTPVDTGLTLCGLFASIQLVVVLLRHNPLDYHEDAVLSWGYSNYAAVILVTIGLTVLGRMMACRLPAVFFGVPGIIVLSGIATQSRGALAATVGAILFKLAVGLGRGVRAWVPRLLAVVVVLGAAAVALREVYVLRTASSSAGHLGGNIQERLQLWGLSWDLFWHSPLVGTGFGSLREVSLQHIGIAETFAHNVEISMLQQAGLLALPFLAVLGVCAYAALFKEQRSGFALGAVAVLIAAQVEPVFEGTIGGFIGWLPLLAAYMAAREAGWHPWPSSIGQHAFRSTGAKVQSPQANAARQGSS